MKKKVMFLEPRGAYSNVFDKFMTIPLLGPVYLATIAKKAGYDVSVVNENILGREIKESEFESVDVLCLSCITATVERGKHIAKKYKHVNPEGKTIIGGIHASMLPDDVQPHFDQVVVGEGENVILDVLSGSIEDKIVHGKRLENLDELPHPDFSLIKEWHKIKTWPVMTSRGCPFNCNFCSVTEMFGRGYRAQSPERVIDELMRHKKGSVFIVDDHFAANPKRTDDILNLMLEYGFDRSWSAQVRADVTKNPEFVKKMKRAGCNTVYVGFESINPESLKEMKKGQTVQDIEHAINTFHKYDILIHGMFMLGNDSDTKETFKATSKFCRRTGVDYVQYTILTPLPGTELYRKLEKQGRLLHKKWQYYDALHVVSKPKNMTAKELQQGLIECFSDFYSYTNAMNDALNIFAETLITAFNNTKARLPSLRPFFMKFAAKEIIRNWVRYNRPYFRYLKYV